LSTIALLRAICRVVLYLAHVLQNSPLLQAKIVYLPPLLQRLLRCAMQRVNLRSYIVAKEISVSVSLLPNVYLGFATLCQLAHR
jgi:hypothetical protein